MTPDDFKKEMKRLSEQRGVRERHENMDDLMCEYLIHLGFREGIEIFRETENWWD